MIFNHDDWREPVEFMYQCSTKWAFHLGAGCPKKNRSVPPGVGLPSTIRVHHPERPSVVVSAS